MHEDFSTGALERANPDRITLTPTEFKGARAATGVRKRKRSSAEPGKFSIINVTSGVRECQRGFWTVSKVRLHPSPLVERVFVKLLRKFKN